MSGASELAALAALRAGAGYVLHLASGGSNGPAAPHAIVRRDYTAGALAEDRIGAVVIGPGLGRGRERAAFARLVAEAAGKALLVDADGLMAFAGATAELGLGGAGKFWPSDEALEKLKPAEIVYSEGG